MTSITIHGAAGEIGGNKILVEDKKTKIFLDFGLSFTKWGNYFTPYLQPRKWSYLSDFTKMGILPDLEGLYRLDFESRIRKSKKEPDYDAIVLSHPHLDHAGFLSYIRTDIPVHCSPGCKGVLQAFEETAVGFHEYTRIKESFKLRTSKTDSTKLVRETKSTIPREFHLFKPKVDIDDFTLHTFPVDHSVPGANSFVLETSEGAIVYTGDIRFHGRKSNYSKLFVEKAAEFDPVVVLSEGTRISDRTTFGEVDLERRLYSLVSDVDGLVIVNFPIRDTDRMRSFINAAKSADRKLVINMKQAYTIRLLEQIGITDLPKIDEIGIYVPRKGWGILNNDEYPDYIQMKDYLYWEQELLDRPNSVTDEDIKENPNDFIFRCDFYELKYLFDVEPPEGSKYIRSVTEPVDEEMELEKVRADNWLTLFNLYPYEQIHCSGHASGVEIKEMIDQIAPKTLIPIHTEAPKVFGDFHTNTVVKKLGEKYVIN